MLGVRRCRLRQWRQGVAPSSAHLFALPTLAERMGMWVGASTCRGLNPPEAMWNRLAREAPA